MNLMRTMWHRWGAPASAVVVPCCLLLLVLIARQAIVRSAPHITTVIVATEQLPSASDPVPLLHIIAQGWREHGRLHPHLRAPIRNAMRIVAERAVSNHDRATLTAVAETLAFSGMWPELPEKLRQTINQHQLKPRPNLIGFLILLAALVLPIVALITVWRRWRNGPLPVDPKAETLENVEAIDVDTSDITIANADTAPGTHITTIEEDSHSDVW